MSCGHELANEWARCSGKYASYKTIIIMIVIIIIRNGVLVVPFLGVKKNNFGILEVSFGGGGLQDTPTKLNLGRAWGFFSKFPKIDPVFFISELPRVSGSDKKQSTDVCIVLY